MSLSFFRVAFENALRRCQPSPQSLAYLDHCFHVRSQPVHRIPKRYPRVSRCYSTSHQFQAQHDRSSKDHQQKATDDGNSASPFRRPLVQERGDNQTSSTDGLLAKQKKPRRHEPQPPPNLYGPQSKRRNKIKFRKALRKLAAKGMETARPDIVQDPSSGMEVPLPPSIQRLVPPPAIDETGKSVRMDIKPLPIRRIFQGMAAKEMDSPPIRHISGFAAEEVDAEFLAPPHSVLERPAEEANATSPPLPLSAPEPAVGGADAEPPSSQRFKSGPAAVVANFESPPLPRNGSEAATEKMIAESTPIHSSMSRPKTRDTETLMEKSIQLKDSGDQNILPLTDPQNDESLEPPPETNTPFGVYLIHRWRKIAPKAPAYKEQSRSVSNRFQEKDTTNEHRPSIPRVLSGPRYGFIPWYPTQTEVKNKEDQLFIEGVRLNQIVQKFITYLEPCSSTNIDLRDKEDIELVAKVFSAETVQYLEERGFSPEHVMFWAWIVQASTHREASLRLEAVTHLLGEKQFNSHAIPNLVLYSVLDVPNRDSLSLILQLLDKQFQDPALGIVKESDSRIQLLQRVIARLREHWPSALPLAADLVAKYVFAGPPPTEGQPPVWVSEAYNGFLYRFSAPPRLTPFRYAKMMQQCQFTILRKMDEVKAPITRIGYRAIIKVQGAQAKGPVEKDYTRSMSKDWPPWPEERDGWEERLAHFDKKFYSRPAKVIQQMVDAGYDLDDWEREASVLAGIDTDDSPTLHTRTFWHGAAGTKKRTLWAARVRATRSLEEAWSIFLDCGEQTGIPAPDAWEEMFMKCIWAEKRSTERYGNAFNWPGAQLWRKNNFGWSTAGDWYSDWGRPQENKRSVKHELQITMKQQRSKQIVAGDGREVLPAPLNPSDGVYIPLRPPSVEELWQMMREAGIRPKRPLTQLLVKHAVTVDFAKRVLAMWPSEYMALIAPLRLLPESILGPFPSPEETGEQDGRSSATASLIAGLVNLLREHALDEAILLVRSHRPAHPEPWHLVCDALRRRMSQTNVEDLPIIFSLYNEMKDIVEPDREMLRVLALTADRALTKGIETLQNGKSIGYVIRIFRDQLGMDKLTAVPLNDLIRGEELHAYVRALGVWKKYSEIGELLVHLEKNNFPLHGRRFAGKVLVAAKVFLDGILARDVNGYGERDSPEVVKQRETVRAGLEDVVERGWGGWPAEEELETYRLIGEVTREKRGVVQWELS